MRFLLVGLDGLDIEQFSNPAMPTFRRLVRKAQWGCLESPPDPTSGPCWTTVLTGWKPSTHKVKHGLGYPVPDGEWFLSRPHDYLFDLLPGTVGVFNFPSLLKPRRVNGWMVAGWPGPPQVYPPSLKVRPDFATDLPDYAERFAVDRKPEGSDPGWEIWVFSPDELLEIFQRHYVLPALHMLATFPPVDNLLIQANICDRAGHLLSAWASRHSKRRKGASNRRYQEFVRLADRFLASLWDATQPEVLAVVSDHGFREGWHSTKGSYAIIGPDVHPVRLDMDQVDFFPTLCDALGLEVQRDGQSCLLRETEIQQLADRLHGLGYR